MALSNGSGGIAESYDYDEFGKPTTTFSLGNPFLFNGRQYDAESEYYYYRTRYLNPKIGRFINRDTIGIWGDPSNLGNGYVYVGNNPWTFMDPFELDSGLANGINAINNKLVVNAQGLAGGNQFSQKAQNDLAGLQDGMYYARLGGEAVAITVAQGVYEFSPTADYDDVKNNYQVVMDTNAPAYGREVGGAVIIGTVFTTSPGRKLVNESFGFFGWLWNKGRDFCSGKKAVSVWNLAPFPRVKEIESIIGSNLPFNFKKIDVPPKKWTGS